MRGEVAPNPETLRALADESLPEGIALMRIMLSAADPAELDRLGNGAAICLTSAEHARVRRHLETVRTSPDLWRQVRATAAEIPHRADEDLSPEVAVARLSRQFDLAARRSPEASVALYSLGDPERLRKATEEIVSWMKSAGLLAIEKTILDIGCGIGRFELAAADTAGGIVGCDISVEMIAIAQARCAGLANISFHRTGGLDLAFCRDASFDGIVSVDAFPYLVQSGGGLSQIHIVESARILRPGGSLAILNYSYRGSIEEDAAEIEAFGEAAGLRLVEAGARPFRTWDGAVFMLEKP